MKNRRSSGISLLIDSAVLFLLIALKALAKSSFTNTTCSVAVYQNGLHELLPRLRTGCSSLVGGSRKETLLLLLLLRIRFSQQVSQKSLLRLSL